MANGSGLALVEQRLTEKKQGKKGFDPAGIIAIINAIIAAIQNCKAPTPNALRRRLLNRARLASTLRAQGLAWGDAYTQADELFGMAEDAKDADLQLVIDDCCG